MMVNGITWQSRGPIQMVNGLHIKMELNSKGELCISVVVDAMEINPSTFSRKDVSSKYMDGTR